MISKSLYTTGSSWLTVRSALFADSTTTCPVKHLFHDVLSATRQFLRDVFKSKTLPSEVYRKQHRLPVEYFRENAQQASHTSKFKFVSYKPGSIYRVTSKWCTNSLTNSWRADLLRKFYRGGSGPLLCFVGFALAKKPSLLTEEEELEGVTFLIRESFSSLPLNGQNLNIDKGRLLSSITLADLKVGELLAKGCNAAIYSAGVSDQFKNDPESKELGSNVPYFNFSSKQQNQITTIEDDPEMIEIGKNIGSLPSSNSVLSFEEQKGLLDENIELKDMGRNPENSFQSRFFMPHFEGQYNQNNCIQKEITAEIEPFGEYNMAVKVMFNYSAESNAYAIWNAMYRETLPLSGEFSLGDTWKTKVRYSQLRNCPFSRAIAHLGLFPMEWRLVLSERKKKLRPHPNIVKMYSAFADQFPLLPGATKNFPQALPSRLLYDGCGRNMTLFLVMKRYHCCLKDYLQSQNIKPETSLLLFTQLLEALVHLLQNDVAHRDLKSDNILLDLSLGIGSPRLAIADFGCCLENLSLPYTSYDINKGGNMSLMAPEVVNCEPGPFSTIDYSRADLWAAGTIAYEMFGGTNPFYSTSSLKNNNYKENDLPPFPNSAPPAIKRLVMNMLQVYPSQETKLMGKEINQNTLDMLTAKLMVSDEELHHSLLSMLMNSVILKILKRPSQNFSATVCQLLLHAPPSLLFSTYDAEIHKKALKWMFQLSATTYLEASVLKPEDRSLKLELKSTFCSRIQYLEVIEALKFILEP